ncbi:MAG: hypothetical protein PVSMB10_18070 [Pseudarthrobacter sp.]
MINQLTRTVWLLIGPVRTPRAGIACLLKVMLLEPSGSVYLLPDLPKFRAAHYGRE